MDANKNLKIMIIDDDHFLLGMYVNKFQKAGLEVASASDGDEALKKLKEGWIPDIFLCDIIMPGMDGLELLSEVRKQNLGPHMVVIVLTNQGRQEDIDKARDLGIDGYIVKATSIPSEVVSEVLNIHKGAKKQ